MSGVAVAVVIGLVIAFVYTLMSKKDGYNKSFIVGLALLPAIVAAVILLVGSNVARAFSMAGAFALVRFRSAPGSAKDISIVFFSMVFIGGILINLDIDVKDPRKRDEENGYEHQNSDDHKFSDELS